MDNFTMLQNAARRQIDGERTGFASLSRVDQADRWAAWQASADMPRAERDTYSYGPAHIDSPYDEFSRAYDLPDVMPEQNVEPNMPNSRMNERPASEPPKRSFALYNEIMAKHNRIFGHS